MAEVLELRVNDDSTVAVYKNGVRLGEDLPSAVPGRSDMSTVCENGQWNGVGYIDRHCTGCGLSPMECDKWKGNGPPHWPGEKKLIFPAYFTVKFQSASADTLTS